MNNVEKITVTSPTPESELIIAHAVPRDVKKLSRDIVVASTKSDTPCSVQIRRDAVITVTPSEIQTFLTSIRETVDFVNFLR